MQSDLEKRVNSGWKRTMLPATVAGILLTTTLDGHSPYYSAENETQQPQEFIIEFGDQNEDENVDSPLTRNEYRHAAYIIEKEGDDIITGDKRYFGKQHPMHGIVYSFFGKKFDGKQTLQGVAMEGNPIAEQYRFLMKAYGNSHRCFMAMSQFVSDDRIVVAIDPDLTGEVEIVEVDLHAKTKTFIRDQALLQLYKESYDSGIRVILELYRELYPLPPELSA